MIYSSDQGNTWHTINLPSYLNSPIYSVTYDSNTNAIWIGGRGWIATGMWQNNSTQWAVNDAIQDQNISKPVTRIYHSDQMASPITVAVSGASIFSSINGVDWATQTYPGYVFADVISYTNSVMGETLIYASVGGLLNEFTGFKGRLTSDRVTWSGFNNQIHANKFLIV
jgi:hypothetical protein